MYGATIGRTSIWGIDAATNQACAVAQPHKGLIDSIFLYYFLLTQKQAFIKRGKGGAQPNISQTLLKKWQIFLPPLPEQHRIVAKIEQLFSELDKGVAELKKAREKLKLYRQSLLKAAFEGRLTEKWRKEHADELESAEKLLARIKAEREKRYQQQLEEWQQAVKEWEAQGKPGKKPKKPRKPKELPPLTKEELAELPELPEGWVWVTFEHAGFWQGGGTPSKRKSELWKNGKIPWITPKDMKGRYLYESQDKISQLAISKSAAKLINPPSVLFVVRSGILRRILPVAVAKVNTTVNQDIKAIEPHFHLPEFIYWYALGHERDIRESCAKAGTTVESIEFPSLLRYPLPVISVPEQKMIVSILENAFKTIDSLTQIINGTLTQVETLRQSILKKAFSGKLVPQDPDDEPASELLKRIRAEREKAAKESANRKQTRRRRQ